jgi:hypothetical protein
MTAIADPALSRRMPRATVSFDVERPTLKSPLETVNPVARGGLSGGWSTILVLLGETSRGLDQRATGGVKSFDDE